MSGGLIALLDDVAAIAKVAAASLDDVAAQATKAGAKAAGIVIDDTAVTPRYVVGFAADRELPIIGKIALGSLKNKLLILLPGALALAFFAPWAITPLLMAGGLFLCFEGYEKVHEMVAGHQAPAEETVAGIVAADAGNLEDTKVAGAIRTDLILSAEIMAITLASLPQQSVWMQAFVLAAVGTGITLVVYGAVALIVKADDLGVLMARGHLAATRAIGRGLVKAMPPFLKLLSLIGTAAMLWVGGGIVVHGLAQLGWPGVEHLLESAGASVSTVVGGAGGFTGWLVAAAGSGLIGLALGALVAGAVSLVRPGATTH
jgi:predicted DNA repair protein MutK